MTQRNFVLEFDWMQGWIEASIIQQTCLRNPIKFSLQSIFLRMAPVRSWMTHNFPKAGQVACFPALSICSPFSRAWHRLHIFPRLVSVTHFPAPEKTPVEGFPRVSRHLCNTCKFSFFFNQSPFLVFKTKEFAFTLFWIFYALWLVEKNSRHFSINENQNQNQSWLARTRFP